MSRFAPATRKRNFLRMALIGPSGGGKTYSALAIGSAMGKRIALLDTERSSASLYSDRFSFETADLTSFHPRRYIEAIKDAAAEGFDVLVIDSLSHAWMGKDGILDQADKKGGKFGAWRSLTPEHNGLVDAILDYPGHVIGTMRCKTDYLVDKDEKGTQTVTKVGLAPVQRDGMEYEFDIVLTLDHRHVAHVSKSRCPAIEESDALSKPGAALGAKILAWLEDGEAALRGAAEVTRLKALFTATAPGLPAWVAAKSARIASQAAHRITAEESAEVAAHAKGLAGGAAAARERDTGEEG